MMKVIELDPTYLKKILKFVSGYMSDFELYLTSNYQDRIPWNIGCISFPGLLYKLPQAIWKPHKD